MKTARATKEQEEDVVRVQRRGDEYYVEHMRGRPLSRAVYGSFTLIYHPNHGRRHSRIPRDERWKFPDEVKTGDFLSTFYVRERRYDELGGEIELDLALRLFGNRKNWKKRIEKRFGKFLPRRIVLKERDRLFLAKDRPITDAWDSILWVH